MADTGRVDYDAMSAKERFIALFKAADAARSAAIDKGKSRYDVQQAAVAVWNAWAGPLARERHELEESGEWHAGWGRDTELGIYAETGKNDETRDFLKRASLDAGSRAIVVRSSTGKDKREDESSCESETVVKTVECEVPDFSNFIFPGTASFRNARFRGDASFISACFRGDASFDGARFRGDASFILARFRGDASFNAARFRGDAYFYEARFRGGAYFNSTRFKGTVSFDHANFSKRANFRLVEFLAHASFEHAGFSGAVDFTAIQSGRSFDLKDARFFCQVPKFIQAHFSENPRLDHVKLPGVGVLSGRLPYPDGVTPGKKCDRDDVAAFTTLRKMAIQAQDHLTEHDAFKGENRAHRISQIVRRGNIFARLQSWLFWLASILYDVLTDYGWSYLRPLFVWLVLLAGMAGVYLAEVPAREAGGYPQGCISDGMVKQASLLSLHNGLLFATAGQRAFVNRAYVCLYGRKDEAVKDVKLPARLGLYGTIHTLLSAILIFFILLALRNRFRIK